MPEPRSLLRELGERHRAGDLVVKVDEARPWELLSCSRATFYRALAAGQIPGTLRLGAGYRLQLGVFLAWLGVNAEPRAR